MREPESLDEQALMEDLPENDPETDAYMVRLFEGDDPPEYQHPEDEWTVFEEYERMTDEHLR